MMYMFDYNNKKLWILSENVLTLNVEALVIILNDNKPEIPSKAYDWLVPDRNPGLGFENWYLEYEFTHH